MMWEEGGRLRRRREGKLRAGDKRREERARVTREEGQRPWRLEGAPARQAGAGSGWTTARAAAAGATPRDGRDVGRSAPRREAAPPRGR